MMLDDQSRGDADLQESPRVLEVPAAQRVVRAARPPRRTSAVTTDAIMLCA